MGLHVPAQFILKLWKRLGYLAALPWGPLARLHPESTHLIHHVDKEKWDNLRVLSKGAQTQQAFQMPGHTENEAGQTEGRPLLLQRGDGHFHGYNHLRGDPE